ncbi:putative transcriptional regulator, GntR family [Deinococcus aerius]|uniref:Putative transcriptional regulator, GntR family n=1 Tax=Deinococcus aerius TaxID=200253 RepID=A0A2I9CWN3_9DEIO|nr:GntR family transcriptional regulator [Deinococcus aerius]GBF06434.1 putative transcriptional regulator, GntR family [Deinococcus aerius]
MLQENNGEAGLLHWLGGQIDPHSGVPIYLQVRQALTRAVQRGTLRPGDGLPTVRALASELRLAPSTITRAYAELQRGGLIESRAGAGTTVSPQAKQSLARAESQEGLLEELRDILHRLFASGMSPADVQANVAQVIQGLGREAR